MNEIHQDLSGHRTYLWIIVGVFLGVALVMLTMRFISPKGFYGANKNNTVSPSNLAPGSNNVSNASPSYIKALENPDKPYTDEKGVTHPPIGVAPTAYNPEDKVTAPPIGGTGKAPVAPVAQVAPKPVTPKTTTTVVPKVPTAPTAPPVN
jgi:hypothetical protein